MQGRDRATLLATYSSFILSSAIKERSRVRDRGGGVGEGEGEGVTPYTRCAFCRLCFVPLTTAVNKGEDINTLTIPYVGINIPSSVWVPWSSVAPSTSAACTPISALSTSSLLFSLTSSSPSFSFFSCSMANKRFWSSSNSARSLSFSFCSCFFFLNNSVRK